MSFALTSLSRRTLIAGTAGAAALAARPLRASAESASSVPDPVVVVLQCVGGNDGLNTLVPDVGVYHDHRPNIGVDFGTCVPIPGHSGYGLHPSFAPLAPMLGAGQVGIVAGVGMPGQSRSH